MKVNELMVSDLVYNHRNWICSIVEIHKDSAVIIAKHYGEEEFKLDDLRPISLTPEILEKNGFKYVEGYGYSFVNRKELSGDGFEEEKVYINTALNTLIIYTAASSIHLPVKYIHELQHALKLCGIEKEIKL